LKPVQLKRKTKHKQKRINNFSLDKEKLQLGHRELK